MHALVGSLIKVLSWNSAGECFCLGYFWLHREIPLCFMILSRGIWSLTPRRISFICTLEWNLENSNRDLLIWDDARAFTFFSFGMDYVFSTLLLEDAGTPNLLPDLNSSIRRYTLDLENWSDWGPFALLGWCMLLPQSYCNLCFLFYDVWCYFKLLWCALKLFILTFWVAQAFECMVAYSC